MIFYDMPQSRMPESSSYYFNISVICIGISTQDANEYGLTDGIQEIWYLDNITNSHPSITKVYIEEDLDIIINGEEDEDYQNVLEVELSIYCYPHQVVEITKDNEIFHYDLIDFETHDPWRID